MHTQDFFKETYEILKILNARTLPFLHKIRIRFLSKIAQELTLGNFRKNIQIVFLFLILELQIIK